MYIVFACTYSGWARRSSATPIVRSMCLPVLHEIFSWVDQPIKTLKSHAGFLKICQLRKRCLWHKLIIIDCYSLSTSLSEDMSNVWAVSKYIWFNINSNDACVQERKWMYCSIRGILTKLCNTEYEWEANSAYFELWHKLQHESKDRTLSVWFPITILTEELWIVKQYKINIWLTVKI